jgi:hypothetical protein
MCNPAEVGLRAKITNGQAPFKIYYDVLQNGITTKDSATVPGRNSRITRQFTVDTTIIKVTGIIDDLGCETTGITGQQAKIVIHARKKVVITTPDTFICRYETVPIRVSLTGGTPPYNFTLRQNALQIASVRVNHAQDTVIHRYYSGGSLNPYRIIVGNVTDPLTGCVHSNTDTMTLNVERNLQGSSWGSKSTDTICGGDTAHLAINLLPAVATDILRWKAIYRTDNIVTGESRIDTVYLSRLKDTILVSPENESRYTLVAYGTERCTYTQADSVVRVLIQERPLVEFVSDTEFCLRQNGTINLVVTRGVFPITINYTHITKNGVTNYIYTSTSSTDTVRFTNYMIYDNAPPWEENSYARNKVIFTSANSNSSRLCSYKTSDTFNYSIKNPGAKMASLSSDTLCSSDTLKLNFSLTYGKTPWRPFVYINGGVLNPLIYSTDTVINIINNKAYTYSFAGLIDGDGCEGMPNNRNYSDTLKVNEYETPMAWIEGDTAVYPDKQIHLHIKLKKGKYPYTVKIGFAPSTTVITGSPYYTFSAYSDTTIIVSAGSETGFFKIMEVTDGQGCRNKSSDEFRYAFVNIYQKFSAKIATGSGYNGHIAGAAGNDTSVCYGEKVGLRFGFTNGVRPLTVNFVDSTGGTYSFVCNFDTTVLFSAKTKTDVYTLSSVIDGTGEPADLGLDSIVGLRVFERAAFSISGDVDICKGDTAELNFNVINGKAPYRIGYRIDNGGVFFMNILKDTVIKTRRIASVTYKAVSVEDGYGCRGVVPVGDSTARITVREQASISLAGDTALCKDEVSGLKFIFTGEMPFTASLSNGLKITANNDTILYKARDESIVYSLISAEDIYGCEANILKKDVDITVWDVPSMSITGDTLICPDFDAPVNITLHKGQAPFSVEYKDNKTAGTTQLSVLNDTILKFKAKEEIIYSLISFSDSKGCVGELTENDSAEITLHNKPDVSMNGDTAICKNAETPINFTAQNGVAPYTIFYKNDKIGMQSFVMSGTDTSITTAYNESTLQTVVQIIDNNNCVNKAGIDSTARITIFELPNISLKGDTSVCEDLSTKLYFAVQNGKPPYNIFYKDNSENTENFILSGADTTLITANSENNLYTVIQIIDSNKCSSMPVTNNTANVTVYDRPVAWFAGDTSVCSGNFAVAALNFSGGTAPYKYTFVYKTNSEQYFANESLGPVYRMSNPVFNTNTYTLISVEDKNNCQAEIGETDNSIIHKAWQRPTAAIKGDTSVCKDEISGIEFLFTGDKPFYTNFLSDGTPSEIVACKDTVLYAARSESITYSLVSIKDTHGCEGSIVPYLSVVNINVWDVPQASLSKDTSVCPESLVPLDIKFAAGRAPFLIEYEDDKSEATTTLSVGKDTTLVFSASDDITYTFSLSDKGGCVGEFGEKDSVKISLYNNPSISLTGDTAVCKDEKASLFFTVQSGKSPYTVYYKNDKGLTSDFGLSGNDTILTLEHSATTKFAIVSVEDRNGCVGSSSDSANIVVFEQAEMSVGGDTSVCRDVVTPLRFSVKNGKSPYTISYKNNNEEVESFKLFGTDTSLTAARTENVVYTAINIEDSNNCKGVIISDSSTAEITVYNPISVAITGDTTVCKNSLTPLRFTIENGASPYTVLYKDDKENEKEFTLYGTDTSLTAARTENIIYTVINVTDNNGCIGMAEENDSVKIVVNELPNVNIKGDTSVCLNDSAFLGFDFENGTAPYTVLYRDIDGIQTSFTATQDTAIKHRTTKNTRYNLISLRDSNNCMGQIAGKSEVVVKTHVQPSGYIYGFEEVCEGSITEVNVVFQTGTAPYTATIKDDKNRTYTITTDKRDTCLSENRQESITYTLTGIRDKNGCAGNILSNTATIIIHKAARVALLGDTSVCEGEETSVTIEFLSGDTPLSVEYIDGKGQWLEVYSEDGSPVVLTESRDKNESYLIVSVSSYGWWCDLPADEPEPDHTAEIEVYPRPAASIYGDTTICRGSESPLSFDFEKGIAPYIISYIDNKGGTHKLTAYQDTALTGVRSEDIVYEATAIESFDGCSGTITSQNQATIITRNLPAVSLIGDTAVCEGIPTNITFNITESSKPYVVSYKDNKGGDHSFQTENLQEIFTAERFDSINYTLTGISDTYNCVGSVLKDSMAKITVYPRPHITDFSGDTAVCTSADLPLLVAVSGGLPPYILELNGIDTLRLHGTDTSVVNRETGSKKYILTHSIDMRGCYGIIDGSDSVIMNVWGTPPALIKGEDTSVCKGSEVPIDFKFGTGAPPFVITYKNDGGEQNKVKTYGDTAVMMTVNQTTKYTILEIVDSNDCHAEISEDSTRVVTVYNTPIVAVLGDTTVCNEAAASITFVSSDASVESYIVYKYNDVAFADTFTGSKTITDTLTGRREYKLISYFEEHGCEGLISGDSNIALVQAYGIPVVNIYGDTSVCPLAPASLRIGFENGIAPYTVTLNSGNLTYSGVGGELNGDTSFIVEWAATDSITLKALTDSKGCIGVIGADSIAAVNIFETPIGWIEGDTSVCFGDTALVSLFFDKGKAPYTADINGITYSVLNDTVIKYRIMADESPFALLSLSDSNNCAGNVIADSNFAVSVYEKPVVSISGDTGANYGTIVPVGIAVAGGASPYTITSEPFGTIILNANDTTILDIADVTHYDIVKSVVEMHGCAGEVSDKDSITVTVNSVWATIDGDTAICLGEGTTMYFSCERYSPWMLYLRDSTAGTWQQYTIYGSDTAIIVYPQATTVFYIDSIQNSAGNSNVLYIDRQASVEVFPIPTAVIGNDTAVCLGQSAKITMKFTGTAPWTVWIQDGTGTGTQEFFNKTIIRTLAPTNDAKLQITAIEDDNGCRNDTISYKNEVTVKVHALPQIKFLGDTAVCEGTETSLNITKTAGTSPLVLHGNKGSLKFYGADTVLRAACLVSDTFKITQIIDSNGCVRDINDSVKITVFSTPVASIYGDTSVCPLSETPVQIEFANGKAPYTATLSIGTFSFLQDSSLIVVRAATDSITLKSFIDSNGCAGIIGADSIVKINVFETPEAWIKGDTSICYSDTAFVSLFFDKGRAPYKAVINGVEYIASEDTILKYKITADSRFTLESLSDYNNCTGLVLSDSNTVDIISYDLPTVSLTKDTTICMGDEGSINVSFTGESPYQFNYVLDGLEQSRKVENDTTFTVVVNDTVLMKFLQVTDAHTCAGFPFTKDSVVKITPQPLPKITLAKDTTLCLDGITEVPLNIFMSGVAPVFTTIAQRTANTTNIDTLWLGKDTTLILKPVETTKYTVLYAKDEMCYNTSPSSKPGSDSIEVTFVSKTKPTASLSNDTAICAEKTVKVRFDFTGEAPWKLKYKIKTADGTENIETIEGITSPKYEPSITPSQTITYRILGISDNICQDLSSGDSLTITLNALPTAKISGGKIYCTEAEATELKLDFTGKKPFKMLYTENNGMPKTAFSALDALSGTINVKPATTTLFAIHSVIDGNGCEAKAPLDTTTVTVLPQPSVALTKDTSVCHGETVLLNLRVKNTPAPYQLTTIPFGKITVRKDTVFAIKPGTSQSYEITQIKDANGCVNDTLKRAKVAVTVWQRPAAAFVTKDTTLCPEGTAIISTALTGTQPYEITYIIAGKDSVMRAVAGTGKTFTLSPQNTTDISIKEIIDVHGCNTLPVGQNIVITMHALPTISIKGDSAFCDYGWSVPARINLGGTPPFTVQYKTMEGTDAQSFSAKVNRADTAFVFKPEQNMSVELVHVSDKICSTPATGNISFTVRPLPVAKIFDLDQICKDDSTELSFALEEGTPPYSLQYEANGIKREVTGIAQSPYNVWQSPKTTTNYTLLKVNDLYCENIAFAERKTGTIIVWNRPGAVITGDTSVCEGVESAKLYFPTTAYPPFIITYRDENTGSVFSKRFTSLTPTPYTDVNFGVQTTKYKLLKIEDSVCVSEKFTDSVATITVMDAPEVELLTPDTSVCRGSNFDMRLKIVGGTAPFIVSYLINGKEHEKTGIYGERENITFRADTTINILVARVRDKNCFNRFDAMHEARIDYRVLPTASLLNTDTTVCPNMPIRLMFGLTGAFPLAITYSAGDEIKIEKDIDRNTHGVNVKVPETATRYRLTKIQDAYCENTAFGSIYADLYEYPQILKEPQEIFYGEGEEIWFEMEAAGDIIEYQVIGNNKLIGTYDDPRFSLPNADIDDRGYYNFIVKGICGDTSSIIVKAIFELDASLIHQKWNNLLIMSNVPYKFVDGAYQWYRNDIPLDGNHKAFHSAGPNATDLLDFNAWYKVRVVMVANGDTFFTRKMMPEKQNDMIIFAAPNPVSMGTFIDVGVGKESLSHDAVIDIFDAQGKRINSVIVPAGEAKKRIYLNNYKPGLYFFKITEGDNMSAINSSNGVFLPSGLLTRTLKVIVTK